MSLASAVISKVNSALTTVKATDRVVCKRLLSRGGGDPLIGRVGSVVVTDTVLNPQPAVFRQPVEITTSQTSRSSVSTYSIIASPDSLSESDLSNKDIILVFKNNAGTLLEEVFINSFVPYVIDGTVVGWKITARSVVRG
jgi:hypothetical protein